jgi:hypothetical protein
MKEKDEAIQTAKAAREEEKIQRQLRKEDNKYVKELKRLKRLEQRQLRMQMGEQKR